MTLDYFLIVGAILALLCFPVVVALVIYAAIYVLRSITAFRTMWKAQSEADALRAKKFVLPKTSDEMRPCVEALKRFEKHFVANGEWSAEEQEMIRDNRDRVVQYLRERVESASDSDEVKTMNCCLNMDALHDFKTLYDATMANIRTKESEGFREYTAVVQKKPAMTDQMCLSNPSKLIDLYNSGRAAYQLFHAFIAQAAAASLTANVFMSHNRQPGMKGIYRVLEKGIFKYNDDLEGELDFSQVRDLVRGGIIDLTMKGLAKIAQFIFESDKVTVCRVKDRFNNPSPAGWTDLMVNFYLKDDPGNHVCEVQLIHFKMLSQRTTQEGHGAYNIYRAAAELLKKTSSRRFNSPRRLVSSGPRSPSHARVVPEETLSSRPPPNKGGNAEDQTDTLVNM